MRMYRFQASHQGALPFPRQNLRGELTSRSNFHGILRMRVTCVGTKRND
jgi:hypothetical protein